MNIECAVYIVIGKGGFQYEPYAICWYESLPDAERLITALYAEIEKFKNWHKHMCANNDRARWDDLTEEYTAKMIDIKYDHRRAVEYDIWHVPQLPPQVL
jgi:hypothetical protein